MPRLSWRWCAVALLVLATVILMGGLVSDRAGLVRRPIRTASPLVWSPLTCPLSARSHIPAKRGNLDQGAQEYRLPVRYRPPPNEHELVSANEQFEEFRLPFNLSHCSQVFLDLGSNQGWQLRKLYSDTFRTNAPWSRVFRGCFGQTAESRRRSVCAVGFEPDLSHNPQLTELEKEFSQLGARVKVIRAPVWTNNELVAFTSRFDPSHHNWGSSLETTTGRKENVTQYQIRAYDVLQLFAQLPSNSRVLVKMDIEGAEHRVLLDLLMSGLLCTKVDFLGVEFHDDAFVHHRSFASNAEFLDDLVTKAPWCKARVEVFDDEE